ncbi:hypothetical protein [Acinetobacter venetianus]|uniref:hypothetical protein n=1 Tax=Acinetobacter venetianus TaxID=52133 RepID=UPI003A932995
MSKLLFATILRKNHEISNCQLDFFWQKARNADLPESIYEIVKPYFHLLPEIQSLYREKGFLNGLTCKQEVKSRIIDCLSHGSQYTKFIVEHIPAEAELVLLCLNELLAAERVKFSYCSVHKSRIYTKETSYLGIQRSILSVLKMSADVGVDKQYICNEVKGVKKKAIRQNISDLNRAGQIQMKQGKYLLIN